MADNTKLFIQFQDDTLFKKWPSNLVFNLTCSKEEKLTKMLYGSRVI